jgi:organic hydroperoxide reductase OsmC/OhrA
LQWGFFVFSRVIPVKSFGCFIVQNSLVRCQTELDLEKQKTVHIWEKETSMQSRQKELESKVEEKQKDIERLEKMLELIKSECNAQVSEKVSLSVTQI